MKNSILKFSEKDRQQIYIACQIIERVLVKNGMSNVDTFISDLENDSTITLYYHNNYLEDEPIEHKKPPTS